MEKLDYDGLISFRSFIECYDMGELDFFNLPDEEYFELTDYMEIYKLKKDYFQKQINSFINRIKSFNSNISSIVPTFDIEKPLGIVFNNNNQIHMIGKENDIWKCPVCSLENIKEELDAIYNLFLEVFKEGITIKTASEHFSITHELNDNIISYEDTPIIYIDDDCNLIKNKFVNKKINECVNEKGYKKLNKNEINGLIKKLYIKA